MDIENQGPSDGMQFTDDQIAFQIIGDYPDAPTLIFLHDSLGCISLWRDFPRRLGALTQCNVLVYDSRKLLIFKWLHLISFVLKISIL
ncbi:hypothetical protein [Flagellimonas zhangzhouensis]|uniref:hypothetical protein n=1 Tax=Flagellimonas zhangzhouensis TaxID=1073328 RepID=UPI000880BDC7|nr:hypothetical protein [Allomuricauda zhangzhouensis]SDQ90480.1 hypothetical protein SAMN05216294_2788 [Allomuricauda zhangzhouensis]